MSYGEKFKLVFSDRYNNPRKLSILQKNYSGSVKDLIGTGDPVKIKWHNKDNIYNPIIGSTCEINLLVTESTGGIGWDDVEDNWNLSEVQWDERTGTQGTDYDNWYESDEREYKVRISTGDISGSPLWDSITDQWQTSAVDWDDPDAQGFEFYWEGFLIVDAYQEPHTTAPYPIKLIASDGLGLLDGFDAPDSNIVYSTPPTIDVSDGSQSNFDSAFYYVRKILENTGLDLDIFIANNIRKSTYSNTDQDTILHDISIFEYGVVNNSNLNLTAKDLLTKILNSINSRIYQSQGRFYIVSNSNLIDQRIFESAETAVATPIIDNIHIKTTENIPATIELKGFDADGLSLTFAITDDVDNGSTSLSGSTVTYTPTTDYVGRDQFYFTATNGTNTSAAAYVIISVVEAPVEAVTPDSFVVPPYNVRANVNVYYGVNITESLSRAKGIGRLFERTHEDFILGEIEGQTHSLYSIDSYIQLISAFDITNAVNVSIGAGMRNGSDPKTWRWGQIGGKMVWYFKSFGSTYGYNLANNSLDPSPPNLSFKNPRTPTFDNAVFSLPNGYYSFRTQPLINNNLFGSEKNQYAAILGLSLSSAFDASVTTIDDYPQDLKDVISNFGANYIVTVRIENDYITERYQFADV